MSRKLPPHESMSISIRSATSADAKVIADFNNRLAIETEDKTLDNNLNGRDTRRFVIGSDPFYSP